jgi:hypothetical protein
MRVVVLAALASAFVVLTGGTARAQATAGAPPVTAAAPPAPAAAAPEKAWSFSASAYTYVLPDSRDYVQPTLAADRGWLHLEGRFNYEDLDTGSAWFGYNFSVGETLTLEFTPMVGAVFGNTTGVAPGYKASLGWGIADLSSETEYVIDTGNSADSFLYTWSELGLTPVDWCRFGLVVQRTKAYKTEFDIQRGLFVGVSYKRADVTAYVLNPDASRPTGVVALGLRF